MCVFLFFLLKFIPLVSSEFPGSVVWGLSLIGKFLAIATSNISSVPFSPPLLISQLHVCMYALGYCLTVLGCSIFKKILFPFLFAFQCRKFLFLDPFLSYFKFPDKLIEGILHFCYRISLAFPFHSFFEFLSFHLLDPSVLVCVYYYSP